MLQFRDATPDDIDAVIAVVDAAYRRADTAAWTTEAHLLGGQRTDATMLAEVLAAPDSVLVVGVDPGDQRVVACVQVTRHDDRTAQIGLVAVDPDRQAAGVGRALLREAERVASVRFGASTTRMTVIRQRTELLRWYARRGYRPTGETEPFPYGDERYGVPRRDDLAFVVLRRALPTRAADATG